MPVIQRDVLQSCLLTAYQLFVRKREEKAIVWRVVKKEPQSVVAWGFARNGSFSEGFLIKKAKRKELVGKSRLERPPGGLLRERLREAS